MGSARAKRSEIMSRLLGDAVRSARLSNGLTQEELAARARIHVTYLSGLERGRRNPTLLIMVRLAEALGVPLSSLLHVPEQKSKA